MLQADEDLETLQQKLSLAYLRKAEIDQEIQRLSPTGIYAFPHELFCDIFENLEPLDSVSLENIRLVCRLWNEAVKNIPRLWSNIFITVPSTLEAADRCNEHCIRHIERSKQSLLDITINCRSRPRMREFLEQLLAISIPTSYSSAIPQWIMDGITFYGDWDPWQPPMHYLRCGRIFEATIDQCEFRWMKPLSTLVGTKGEVMSRWRSFDFIQSSHHPRLHDYTKEIFPEGIKIYPSCESFRLHNVYGTWEAPIVIIDHQRQELRVLELQNVIHQRLDISAIDPLRLLHLSLRQLDISSLLFILQCQNLEHLGIQNHDLELTVAPQQPLTHFLNIRTLEAYGSLPPYFFRFIRMPFLQTLIIHNWSFVFGTTLLHFPGCNLNNLLPSLNRVEFRIVLWPSAEYQLDTLRFVFVCAPLVNTVMIEDIELEKFFNSLSQLDDEGIRPGHLKHLIITKRWESDQREAAILRCMEYSSDLLKSIESGIDFISTM